MLAAFIFLAGDHNFTQWLCFDMFLSVPMEAELYFLIYCCVVLYNQCSPDCLCCFFSSTLSSDKCLEKTRSTEVVTRFVYAIQLLLCICSHLFIFPFYISKHTEFLIIFLLMTPGWRYVCVCFPRMITICFMFRQAFQKSSRVGSMRLIKTEKVCY